MATACNNNCSNMEILYEIVSDDTWNSWDSFVNYFEYQPWFFSIIGSTMVGLSGVLPLLIIPIDDGVNLKNGAGAGTLQMLLSFAVGGLLGDVFLHLLPEAWGNKSLNSQSAKGHPSMLCGLWVLTGFLVFIIAEKLFVGSNGIEENDNETDNDEPQVFKNNNQHDDHKNENNNLLNGMNYINLEKKRNDQLTSMKENGFANGVIKPRNNVIYRRNEMQKMELSSVARTNGYLKDFGGKNASNKLSLKIDKIHKDSKEVKAKHITGYLNLMANCIDNFTHGLAVGGSFLVSFRLGALTTFAILIHEIPHEVGDFAILLKSGFNRWDAARAQLITATGGILGALFAVMFSGSGVESRTSWILPFTAGGFLHIGLVTVLPELLKESNPMESMKQLGALLSGILIMAVLTILCD